MCVCVCVFSFSLYDNSNTLQFCLPLVTSEITTSLKQIKTVDSSDCPRLCC